MVFFAKSGNPGESDVHKTQRKVSDSKVVRSRHCSGVELSCLRIKTLR